MVTPIPLLVKIFILWYTSLVFVLSIYVRQLLICFADCPELDFNIQLR